jgi:hypothetical protein
MINFNIKFTLNPKYISLYQIMKKRMALMDISEGFNQV